MKPLAVLRPEPGASATLGRAQAMGLAAFAMPLFAVEPVAWTAPAPHDFDALLLTSANAVRHAAKSWALLARRCHISAPESTEISREAALAATAASWRGIAPRKAEELRSW